VSQFCMSMPTCMANRFSTLQILLYKCTVIWTVFLSLSWQVLNQSYMVKCLDNSQLKKTHDLEEL